MSLAASEPLATVIVCEDDAVTRELLCDHLEADRFRALPAPSVADGLRLCHYKQPDLLLLDLRLPDGSGLDVLRRIRDCDGSGGPYDPGLPVIVLSGRNGDADRLRGFEAGADDYIGKPVHFAELAMRIRAVLRRRGEARSGPLRAGELFVDPWRREVRVDGRPVKLAKKEFELLYALAGDPLRVFSKEELLRDVWGFRAKGNTRTLDSHASRLRRKLDPEGRRFVVNVWGYGYRLLHGPEPAPAAEQLTVNGAGSVSSLAEEVERALHELRRPLQALAMTGPRRGDPAEMTPAELALGALDDLDAALRGSPASPARRPVSARALVSSAVERWRGPAARAGKALVLRWEAGPVRVVGDPVRLSRALDNLIANALEHGGLRIGVSALTMGSRIRLEVSDRGRIAGPSRRRKPASGRSRGHGLPIVAGIAREHGGTLGLARSGTGTVAILELPLAET